jgi:hypothetical protein
VDLEPIWTSLQKEVVQKLVSQGRELMKSGKLEDASEVLRKALSIDAGNVAAKTLFDQVGESLGPTSQPVVKSQRITADQDRILAAPLRGDKQAPENRQGGTVAFTPRFDPQMPRVMEPDRTSGDSSNPPVQRRGRHEGGTIDAPAAMERPRNDRPAPPAPGQRSAASKAAPPKPATPQSPAPYSHRGTALQTDGSLRNRAPIFTAAGVVALLIIGAAGFWKLHPRHEVAEEPQVNLAPLAPPETPSAVPAAAPVNAPTKAPEVAPTTGATAAPLNSIENQQRLLVDQARAAGESKDYKTARARLDEAAKLNGPLSASITFMRRQFNDAEHAAEMRQAAQQEQTLWARATQDLEAGRFDDSEQSSREILTLPEAGPHWEDAARYVDEVIPERRKGEQLWTRAQQESGLTGHEHRINEVKILDQILAAGGVHQRGARQRRDSLFSQFTRENLRRNNSQDSAVSASQQVQFPLLEDAVDQAVALGDAKALQQLQEIRPRFKSIADGGGPFLLDARDYLNNVIPKAQNAIEAKLANAEADTLSNAKFREAMKQFDQAVAAQNTKVLRSEIKSEFQGIASSGGPRTKEAERYVEDLIPAALKKDAREGER